VVEEGGKDQKRKIARMRKGSEKKMMNNFIRSAKTLLKFSAIFMSVILAFYIFVVVMLSSEDRRFDEQVRTGIDKASELLVQNGICASRNDCARQQIISFIPKNGGFSILVYGVNDERTSAAIALIFTDEFIKESKIEYLDLTIYKTKETNIIDKLIKFNSLKTMKIEMRRNK
jgi:hypothetical protein